MFPPFCDGFYAFQSTLSMRRATEVFGRSFKTVEFQSTLSMRRATGRTVAQPKPRQFQSTLSMRRATNVRNILQLGEGISIHALHEESDRNAETAHQNHRISIHALHEESDSLQFTAIHCNYQFQSTLSMRRATRCR